jgi:uncharacterized membrane protein
MHKKIGKIVDELGIWLSEYISNFGGSWSYVFWFLGLSAIYMIYNLVSKHAFDLWPFAGLNLLLGFIASLTAPFIMMSSNRQDKIKRRQTEEDLKVGHDTNKRIKELEKDLKTLTEMLRKSNDKENLH